MSSLELFILTDVIIIAIVGIKPVLTVLLWYFEKRLDQEKRRYTLLQQRTTYLETALKITDLVSTRFGTKKSVSNPPKGDERSSDV